MTTFVFTLTLMAGAMAAMAVGVILSNRQLQGSCGGTGGKDCICSIEERKKCSLIKHGKKTFAKTIDLDELNPLSKS